MGHQKSFIGVVGTVAVKRLCGNHVKNGFLQTVHLRITQSISTDTTGRTLELVKYLELHVKYMTSSCIDRGDSTVAVEAA